MSVAATDSCCLTFKIGSRRYEIQKAWYDVLLRVIDLEEISKIEIQTVSDCFFGSNRMCLQLFENVREKA